MNEIFIMPPLRLRHLRHFKVFFNLFCGICRKVAKNYKLCLKKWLMTVANVAVAAGSRLKITLLTPQGDF
jgi:hypothetical protein